MPASPSGWYDTISCAIAHRHKNVLENAKFLLIINNIVAHRTCYHNAQGFGIYTKGLWVWTLISQNVGLHDTIPLFDYEFHKSEDKNLDFSYGNIGCEKQQLARFFAGSHVRSLGVYSLLQTILASRMAWTSNSEPSKTSTRGGGDVIRPVTCLSASDHFGWVRWKLLRLWTRRMGNLRRIRMWIDCKKEI